MTSLLLKLFLKGDLADKNVRGKCGTLAGIVGVLCNLLLFAVYFLLFMDETVKMVPNFIRYSQKKWVRNITR